MNPSPRRFAAGAWVALCLFLAGAGAHAANLAIRDQAGFFSEGAESTAARTISEIERSQKKDLVIETFAEVPAEVRRGVDLQDKTAVKRLFESWSVQRARELGLNGIYVVMTREPAHLQVVVGNETQRGAFTLADRDALVGRMLDRLRAKKNDEALIAGVEFVRDTLRSHASSGARAPAGARSGVNPSSPAPRQPMAEAPTRGFSWFSLLVPLLLLGLVGLVVMRLVRALMGRGSFGGTPSPLGGGGGGGFMRSMLGGLFGAAAGMWLYNMFSGLGSNAWGAGSPPTPGGNDGGFPPQDTDYSSSGGDFGDSSGGGDFGGDFGGGDSGGGGDF